MCDIMENSKLYLEERLEKTGFLNGVYIPWFHGYWYGRDIGSSFYGKVPGTCCFNEGFVRRKK